MSRPDLTHASWRKSSYSNQEGGNCVEVADGFPGLVPVRDSKDPEGMPLVFSETAWVSFTSELKAATWHKSTYSNQEGGDCVEVADGLPGLVSIRDSKDPNGSVLVFTAASWATFIDELKIAAEA
ncbi:DUF397 domain-containing protein [Streptomyces sp. NPDC001922]|uniref:DUF397 domain-containing protein n=1 Tax=Streptomyces sp. NPDC001922 TaxID=3364624 RepID=UPI003686AFC9